MFQFKKKTNRLWSSLTARVTKKWNKEPSEASMRKRYAIIFGKTKHLPQTARARALQYGVLHYFARITLRRIGVTDPRVHRKIIRLTIAQAERTQQLEAMHIDPSKDTELIRIDNEKSIALGGSRTVARYNKELKKVINQATPFEESVLAEVDTEYRWE